jgi:hypothetical protein
MIESLKNGLWLTPSRLRAYPLLLLVMFGTALVILAATAHGNFDRFGRPLGPDFTEIWVAGLEAHDGHPAAAYDAAAHRDKQAEFFGETQDYYLWSYPPYFFGIAALFAFFPYILALLLWQASTLGLYLAAVWFSLKQSCPAAIRLSSSHVLIPALAFPAVFVNSAHGQNGFLTAALLAAGLLNLKNRPLMAGALFACLVYKPQFALMVPVALIAAAQWRAIISGAVTLGLLTLATLTAFGTEVWTQFPQAIRMSKSLVLEQGGAGYEKMQSLFAASRLLGASVNEAYILQGSLSIILVGAIAWLWHSSADQRLKGAALLASALLATPYSFDYDMAVLGPALALAVSYSLEKGFSPYEKTLLSCLWVSPLLVRPLATATSIPIGTWLIFMFLIMIILRARNEIIAAASTSLCPGYSPNRANPIFES